MNKSNGFSLIEMLAATVIMGVLIAAVLPPLAQLFRSTGRSDQTLRVTTQAQEVVEYIRGQWQSYPAVMVADANGNPIDQNKGQRDDSLYRYDRTCFALPTVANMTSVVTVQALDRNAVVTGTLNYAACPNPLTAPVSPPNTPMKRISVTLTAADGYRSSLTLDVPRP